jgi:hypothetical protein
MISLFFDLDVVVAAAAFLDASAAAGVTVVDSPLTTVLGLRGLSFLVVVMMRGFFFFFIPMTRPPDFFMVQIVSEEG